MILKIRIIFPKYPKKKKKDHSLFDYLMNTHLQMRKYKDIIPNNTNNTHYFFI